MKTYFVLFLFIILISSCASNQQYQPIEIEEECYEECYRYPPLFIAVFIDEDSSNTNRDADLEKINNLPEDLFLTSSFLLFAVNTVNADLRGESERVERITVEPGSGGQKEALDKKLNEFLNKNNICRECDRDFYMYIVIDNSGSMFTKDVPDVMPWIDEVKATYRGANTISVKEDTSEEWCRWILDGVAAYQDLISK